MITAEQRHLRRQTIGSSDAAAILGVDPWRTAGDVYYSKVADLDDRPNPAMQVGNRMEPVLLDWAEEKLGITLQRGVMQALDPNLAPLTANLDGLCADCVVEAKYVGPNSADYWGEDGTDAVPDHVLVQVQHQMLVTRRPMAYIPAAIVRPFRGLSFEMFQVAADDDIMGSLLSILSGWWAAYVVTRTPPPDAPPHLEILKRIRRLPESILLDGTASGIASILWQQRLEAAEEIKTAEDVKDAIDAKLLALLGEHEAAKLPDGRLLVYREENAGKRLDCERLRREHPNLFEELSHPTTRRVLRLKKGPKP